MKKFLLLLFLLASLPATAASEESRPGYIQIVVVYDAFAFSAPGHLQIRDELCQEPRSIECEEARIKARGESCQQNPTLPPCREAAALLKNSLCLEGLVYDGRVSHGEEVAVEVCASQTGLANVSVRTLNNGTGGWINYGRVVNGKRISYRF